MGKQGPCYHCGITSTPLWRNGPPEKPVLCNACGSRWRTKGTLANYTPLHARAELFDTDDSRKVCQVKPIYVWTQNLKLHKRKFVNDNADVRGEELNSDQNFQKISEDKNNRSSSGSAISYSESCAHVGSTDSGDMAEFSVREDISSISKCSVQSNVRDSLVPSKKRTCVGLPKPSSVEKLRNDLFSILHEQQSSYLSGSSEEDLIYESGTLIDSVEIGHGGVLIKNPNIIANDEESEASSLPIDSKAYTSSNAYSRSTFIPAHNANKGIGCPNTTSKKLEICTEQAAQENKKRDKTYNDKLYTLRSRSSALTSIDLTDVVCFERFTGCFTLEEQKQLMKYLPSADTAKLPDSLKSMFGSFQFAEALSSFQHLLLEGIFDLSFSGVEIEECRTLKKLALVNMTKSKWVEHYELLKDVKAKGISGKRDETGVNSPGCSNPMSLNRALDGQSQNFPEARSVLNSPKRVCSSTTVNAPFTRSHQPNYSNVGIKTNYDIKYVDESSCVSPRSLFAFPPGGSSTMLDSLQFTDDNSDQVLLFELPSYGSFPQAELLDCQLLKQQNSRNSSLTENRYTRTVETLSKQPSSSFNSQQSNNNSIVYPQFINL